MKMQSTAVRSLWAYVAALVLTCTLMSEGRVLADVPPTLIPPQGNVETVRGYATGVQIYHSAQSATDPTKFVWKFFAPEATLFNGGGKEIIHHFGGPTGPNWQSNNGSLVVGALFAAPVTPDETAIPWLLLSGLDHSGNGPLSEVTFIQRINTTGGIAPKTLPTALGQEVRVPYTATYVFFNSKNSSSVTAAHR